MGATLYTPATHNKLLELASGEKYKNLKSLIIDSEDSLLNSDVEMGLKNIEELLNSLEEKVNFLFLRVRNVEILKILNNLKNIHKIDGFVFPKFNTENMQEYFSVKLNVKYIMPILETGIFEAHKLVKIRDFLLPHRDKILTIRVGGNDLMNAFTIRRNCKSTIYDIAPLNLMIAKIITTFKPYGFNVSGAVFECFDKSNFETLEKEVEFDLQNGIFSKTIIHPSQIDVVEGCYKVDKDDLISAKKIVDKNAKAVFKTNNKMNEISVHSNWAREIITRSEIYGVRDE